MLWYIQKSGLHQTCLIPNPPKKVQYITYNYIPAPLSFEKWNGYYVRNMDYSKNFILIIPQIHKGHELLLTQII